MSGSSLSRTTAAKSDQSPEALGFSLNPREDICRQQKSHPKRVAFSSQPMALIFRRERHGLSCWSECFTWHRPIFSGGYPPNIVGATAFHSRVRDGSEWFHCAMDTRIDIRSQVNPENCIGYERLSCLLLQARGRRSGIQKLSTLIVRSLCFER